MISPISIRDRPHRSFYRGGNYRNADNGLPSFNGNNPRSNSNVNIGFRALILIVRSGMVTAVPPVQRMDKGSVSSFYVWTANRSV